jgi:hypothetical protein
MTWYSLPECAFEIGNRLQSRQVARMVSGLQDVQDCSGNPLLRRVEAAILHILQT